VALVKVRVGGIVHYEDCQSFASAEVVSFVDAEVLEVVSGIEHGGSKDMNSHGRRQSAVRRGHLRLAAAVPAEIRLSPREVRAMSRVAVLLRRRAARLPEDSLVRAELMETAEYYAIGADQASIGRLGRVA
jgi:hypothetical protein